MSPSQRSIDVHDDVIKWKHFPRHWPFMRGIHWYIRNLAHNSTSSQETYACNNNDTWCIYIYIYIQYYNGYVIVTKFALAVPRYECLCEFQRSCYTFITAVFYAMSCSMYIDRVLSNIFFFCIYFFNLETDIPVLETGIHLDACHLCRNR